MWEVEEVNYGELRKTLNAIEDRGGTVFQIIDSSPRKDNCHIIWMRHEAGNVQPMKAVK